MAADTVSPPNKRASPGSPHSPGMERVVTHARYKPDLAEYVKAAATIIDSGDAVGSLVSLRDCLWAVNRQLSTIAEVVNQHATVVEGHHTSLRPTSRFVTKLEGHQTSFRATTRFFATCGGHQASFRPTPHFLTKLLLGGTAPGLSSCRIAHGRVVP